MGERESWRIKVGSEENEPRARNFRHVLIYASYRVVYVRGEMVGFGANLCLSRNGIDTAAEIFYII